jgi:hypothetical protein
MGASTQSSRKTIAISLKGAKKVITHVYPANFGQPAKGIHIEQ